ncbi:MAG: hypothetical protein LBU92_03075, partial [Prevotellaceae bacterium]|nr:hypothetical protein [Prevotellaceae bacterium]
QAYEFSATVRNGVIHIPEQLSNENLSWVKVILLADSVEKNPKSRKKFTAMQLKTKGFKFNREEVHER